MIYKSRIHSVLLYLLPYCEDWYIAICLGLGLLVDGFWDGRRDYMIIVIIVIVIIIIIIIIIITSETGNNNV